MSNDRIGLQYFLEDLLGSKNVYFQPPESKKIEYPAIIYGLDDILRMIANDEVYLRIHRYTMTIIDEDPDSEIVERASKITRCSFNRHFKSDNLNHYVFTIYY